MTKKQYVEMIKEVFIGKKCDDKPLIRQTFNDTLDSLHRDGEVTEKQANNWYLTDRELNSIINHSFKAV